MQENKFSFAPNSRLLPDMEACIDFVNCLDADTSTKILMCLDTVSDIVRVTSVSHSWRRFVIANGLGKRMCLKMYPQLSSIVRVMELRNETDRPLEIRTISSVEEQGALEMDHMTHISLARACTSFPVGECIYEAVSASSTDNYPEESVHNTLEQRDRIAQGASYWWSSKGQSNPSVPETLIYKLVSSLCIITEINIQPFLAYFQFGLPIYSAKSVRFRVGHPKYPLDTDNGIVMNLPSEDPADDKFIWTYTSQEFPMSQENRLQKLKLEEPVVCIGGYLQIELLGRVQRQEMDGLYYICLSYVQVRGRSLSPVFEVDIVDPCGKFVLKHLPHEQPRLSDGEDPNAVTSVHLQRRVREVEQILNLLRGHEADVEEYQWIQGNED